ncbi:MAG: hypothetical protein PHC50_06680 [Candidatus Cloacimonetes bacterium]|nr:hypothetical protein [Candidatus Cloacimonadota bacterium]
MKRLVMCILAMLLLAGCVHYDEELWLNRDGSGRAKLRIIHRSQYENPEEILRKGNLPGISLVNYKVQRKNQDVIYDIVFKFKNIEAFNNVNDQLGSADFWGKITLNKEPGRRITFKRRISLGSQESDDELESFFSQLQSEQGIWTYRLHAPWKVITTNASKRSNKTLIWSYDTSKMWNRQELMTVEYRKALPWFVFVIALIAAALVGILINWLFKIAKRSYLLERLNS